MFKELGFENYVMRRLNNFEAIFTSRSAYIVGFHTVTRSTKRTSDVERAGNSVSQPER